MLSSHSNSNWVFEHSNIFIDARGCAIVIYHRCRISGQIEIVLISHALVISCIEMMILFQESKDADISLWGLRRTSRTEASPLSLYCVTKLYFRNRKYFKHTKIFTESLTWREMTSIASQPLQEASLRWRLRCLWVATFPKQLQRFEGLFVMKAADNLWA